MVETNRKTPWVTIGWCLTLGWFLICGWLIYRSCQSPCPETSQCLCFFSLPPNAQGDFLAGAFAPLAFLWLFIATMLQRDELQLQRQVSESQAKEAINQGKIFAQQSELIKRQIEVQTAQLENERQRKKLEQTIRVQNLSDSLADKIKIKFCVFDGRVAYSVKNELTNSVSVRVVVQNSTGIECGDKKEIPLLSYVDISDAFQTNEYLEVFFLVIAGTYVFAYASKGPFSMDLLELTVGNLLPYEVIPPQIIEMIFAAKPIDL